MGWVDAYRHIEDWPEPLQQKVKQLIAQMESDKEHSINDYGDNYRIRRTDNKHETELYCKSFEQGCCGSFDEKYVIDGQQIEFGFNYGH